MMLRNSNNPPATAAAAHNNSSKNSNISTVASPARLSGHTPLSASGEDSPMTPLLTLPTRPHGSDSSWRLASFHLG
jgi:hypothetical protein